MRNNFWIEQAKNKQLAKYMENVPQSQARKMIDENNRGPEYLVENQRLASYQHFADNWLNDTYNRVAIAAVGKIFDPSNFLATQLISMQPMSGPVDKIKYLRFRYAANPKAKTEEDTKRLGQTADGCTLDSFYGENTNNDAPNVLPEIRLVVESEDCAAKTRKMKVAFPLLKTTNESVVDGFRHYYDSYYLTKDFSEKYPEHKEFMEDEMSAYMAANITNEIHAEILTDLRNNAGTVGTFEPPLGQNAKERYESFYIKIVEISGVIHRKTLRGGCNWIVTSPEIVKVFVDATCSWNNWQERDNSELFYHGTMNNRWRLYSSKSAPHDQMLLGYKGDSNQDAGYFYNPYVPLTPVTVLDPTTNTIPIGTLSRYSKKLLREGAKFYARIKVKGF